MTDELINQLHKINPWWEYGLRGINKYYNDPAYHRELYGAVSTALRSTDQIISVVGMRQVGKSTLMRQVIRQLLGEEVEPSSILYVSFDDHYLQTHYDPIKIFDVVIEAYQKWVIKNDFRSVSKTCYLFLDEINQLNNWEKIIKSYYDKRFPVKYFVTGSSAVIIKKRSRESLLGRIIEHTMLPFSFREYIEYQESIKSNGDKDLLEQIDKLREIKREFLAKVSLEKFLQRAKTHYEAINTKKSSILKYLCRYIIDSGFPRAWQQRDFLYRQKFLWEQHISKVLFADLLQAVAIRRPKDLELLFSRMVDFNTMEINLTKLGQELDVHFVTRERYINYLRDLSLVYRLEKTKSKRVARKRKATNVKFYLTDVAIRNAIYKYDEEIFNNSQEMGRIAENLVCIALYNLLLHGPMREEQLGYYRERKNEVDFILKYGNKVIPIEVKWQNTGKDTGGMDKLQEKWGLEESMLITKDMEMSYQRGRLSIPLWFFLLAF